MSTIAASLALHDPIAWNELRNALDGSGLLVDSWDCDSHARFAVARGTGTDVSIASGGSAILHGYVSFADLEAISGVPAAEIYNPCETVLRCVRRFGHEILARISGAFTLIDWNGPEKKLTVCRDWIGLVPLFAARHHGGWILCTRTKPLLAISSFVATPDRPALQHYQYSGWSPRGQSLLQDVIHCEPGTISVFEVGSVRSRKYQLPAPARISRSLHVAASELGQSLGLAVRHHLPASKRIGIAVSGGVDSIYMAALVRDALPDRDLTAFSYGFGPEDPNIRGAAQIAGLLDCNHIAVTTEPEELPELLRESIFHLEEPVGRDQYPMLYKMALAARSQVDSLITGNCGDAVFGTPALASQYVKAARWPILRKPLEDLATEDFSGDTPRSLLGKALVSLKHLKSHAATPPAARVLGTPRGDNRCHFPTTRPPLLAALRHDLENAAGEQAIKANMLDSASGLDLRQPYGDVSLIGLGLSIPDEWRFSTTHTKIALRMAAERAVPANLAWAPKGVSRLRHDDRLWEVVEAMLADKVSEERVQSRGLLEPKSVAALKRLPARRQRSMRWLYRLWYLIALEIWCELFLDNRGQRVVAP
ncbi:asparagine synthase-related protein [Agrobacterium fabrum]|uniref:asparagine synthase-related protein n=1 Tax=Agrobacterium fabrum TaxID=1176649 RepID=UPI003BA03F6A